jgi:uncharacterized membrane protein YcfT
VKNALGIPSTKNRLAWLDRLRGLAIALMILDHALVVTDPTHPLRLTITRLALPLFMICAGALHRPLTVRRIARLAPAVAIEAVISPHVPLAQPGIVTVYLLAVAILAVPAINRALHIYPAPMAVLGILQSLFQPLGWPGYEPGLIIAFLCIGIASGHQFQPLAHRLLRYLEPIGRRPLTWYCGHIIVLATIANV